MLNLPDKYRPRTLADVVGQPWVVEQLTAFARNPYPVAFLFDGTTGTGKTSAAVALARDLGVDVDAGPWGGYREIASGEQTADSVRDVMNGLRCHTLSGSGWKVVVVNECDCLSPQAAFVWLDALENLPPRSVVVLTTNNALRLPARLRDRCERFDFEGGLLALEPYLPALVAKVWAGEGCPGDPPVLEALGALQDDQGDVSVRRVLQALAPLVRAALAALPAPVPPPPYEYRYGKRRPPITCRTCGQTKAHSHFGVGPNPLTVCRACHRGETPPAAAATPAPKPTSNRAGTLAVLADGPATAATIAQRLGIPKLRSTIHALTRAGLIRPLGDGRYTLCN